MSLERHFTFQCPVFPHARHWALFAGQEERLGLDAVSTGVLLLLFLSLSLSLAFLWGSLAYGVDIFGAARTHGIHLSIDGNVGPACLQHLGSRRCNRHCEEFLHQFPVIKGSNKAVLHVPLLLVVGGKVALVGQSSQAVN